MADKIAATWWSPEVGFLFVHLARFIQGVEVLVKFQDKIAEASRTANTDLNRELTAFTTLVKQLPAEFKELLPQRFGADWQKFNFDIIPLTIQEVARTAWWS